MWPNLIFSLNSDRKLLEKLQEFALKVNIDMHITKYDFPTSGNNREITIDRRLVDYC